MLQGEHSAILLTFIKLPFVIKIFVLFIFEWLFFSQVLLYNYFNFDLFFCKMGNISSGTYHFLTLEQQIEFDFFTSDKPDNTTLNKL